jgi:hypothetical protein
MGSLLSKTKFNGPVICLATAVVLSLLPARFHADSYLLAETELSAVTKAVCQSAQPDLTVGNAVFVKGQAGLNGARLQPGARLHQGDVISTTVDGYVAIELLNSEVVTVQPGTLLRVDCLPVNR